MALEKIRGVPSCERARTTSNPNLSVRAGPRRRAVSSAGYWALPSAAQGLTKTACRRQNGQQSPNWLKRTMRRPPAPSLWIDLPAILFW